MPDKPSETGEQPPGGRAAERLREFEEARGIPVDEADGEDQPQDQSSPDDLDDSVIDDRQIDDTEDD
jgi:hypothetical protein